MVLRKLGQLAQLLAQRSISNMNTQKNIWLWVLYDFANSIVSIVFFLYFAQWVVVEKGISDFLLNMTFSMSALLLLVTVPIAGFLLDAHLRRITGLRYTTVATAIFYVACVVFALHDQVYTALIFYTLGLYTYLLSFTFYTPLLNDISSEKMRGRISGYGICANYIGQCVGLLIVLPFAKGTYSLFGGSPRIETLMPAIVIFFLLSLPMILFFHESELIAKQIQKFSVKKILNTSKSLFLYPGVGLFMLAYFLFNDAILTASNNFPIFLQQVWGVSDVVKTYILLGIVITSALGGLVSGHIADKFGHKKTLFIVLVGWVFILPSIGFLTNFPAFVVATTVMGFWFGANWAVSRSVMSYLAPVGQHNLAFAYFGLVERVSALFGPLVWGAVVTGLVSMGSFRYRLATLAVTAFIIIGLGVLVKVRGDR